MLFPDDDIGRERRTGHAPAKSAMASNDLQCRPGYLVLNLTALAAADGLSHVFLSP